MRPDKPLTPFELRVYGHYKVVHGCRIALAFVLTFLLVRLLDVPEGTWPLITLVVVMGPISFWGNVVPRALQRIGGTITGAAIGLVALKLELWSLPLMLLWCALGIFLCGYLAQGKRPYQALLIGITLSVVVGAPPGDMETALWRSGDVIFGSLLAMLFTSIWPQRAFILWRIKMAAFISDFDRLHHAGFSPNLLERPHLETPLRTMLGNMEKLRTLVVPASKETRIPKSILDGIQTVARNMVCTLELQINAWWASRESHFLMINAVTLRETQRMTHRMLAAIELALHDGNLNAIQHASVRQAEIVDELRRLMKETSAGKMHEAPVYGYVWLSLELAQQLELLSQLVSRALRK